MQTRRQSVAPGGSLDECDGLFADSIKQAQKEFDEADAEAPEPVAGWQRLRTLEQRSVPYTHLRAHETGRNLVCRLLL